jgi:hypothetical protein
MSEPKMLTTEERHSHMERLRQFVHTDHERDLIESFADHADAADDAIKQRDAEIERLREALAEIAHNHAKHAMLVNCGENAVASGAASYALGWALDIAKDALKEADDA